MDIVAILKYLVAKEGTDLMLKKGVSPHIRICREWQPYEQPAPLTVEDITACLNEILPARYEGIMEKRKEIDFAFTLPDVGRFRASAYMQNGEIGVVIRRIRQEFTTFEELHLPAIALKKLCEETRGLVIICGSTGSGKSTTIAHMLEHMNATMRRHVITIEDPIEFVFEDKKSLFSQRELGFDTNSYNLALKYAMYQSPDVIYIGTIRDQTTMYAALLAAETGQLVFSNLHAINTVQAIERIVNFFPPYQHAEVRTQLSLLLKGIISMRLIPRKDVPGLIPACEIAMHTPTIARLIREGSTDEILGFIEDGGMVGMQSFNQSLTQLCRQGFISIEEALRHADSPDELRLNLEGFKYMKDL